MLIDRPSELDERLLSAVPGMLSIPDMLKATPRTEGSRRYVYIEASNESVDYEGEVVLAKALAKSADYYLRFGNLDIDHYTQIGHKIGIPDHEMFEIGRPIEVRAQAGSTFVKGEIYSGDGPAAARANNFWSSLTDLSPPARWYPSVGGKVIAKSVGIDPDTKAKRAIVSDVRWTNIGFSKTPVNLQVAEVGTAPFGALTKSLVAGGFDISKALEAGYGTDPATLTGGGAFRQQSLDGKAISYWDFRDGLAAKIRGGKVRGGSLHDLVQSAKGDFDLPEELATRYVQRFLTDLDKNRSNR